MEFGLNDLVRQKIQDVFKSYPELFEAVLYGSRALGSFREGSDIDIA